MTVSSTINREQYATNGVSTAFTIHFPFFYDTDVNAVFVDALGNANALALNADYTVTGGGGAGGTLTTTLAPAGGGVLTVYRQVPFSQEDDYVEDDPLPADTLEGGFDRAVMRDQQLKDAQDRALTFPVTIDPAVSAELPNPSPNAVLGWATDGLSLENKTLAAGTAVYSSTANTNLGASTTEAVTPKGLNDSRYNPNGKHIIPIIAASMQPATTIGAAPGTVETATNKVLYRTLDFDTTTQEFAGFVLPMPKSWDEGAVTFRARWTAASGSGGVAWALQGLAVSDADVIDQAYGTEQVVTDTLLSAGDMHATPESAAITIAGTPAEGDVVMFRVKRVPANASDTLGVDARLIAIDLFITTNAGTDA